MRIFIASAMRRQDGGTRQMTLSIRNHLREEYGEDSVYLACHEYPSPTNCQPPRAAFEESQEHIRQADAFVLFSPEGAASPGALVELGLALAWGKPVLALVPTTDALPYFLWLGTKTMTHLITEKKGVPGFWGAGETYFRFIKAFIELRVLGLAADGPTSEEAHAQLDERSLPLFGPEADPYSEYYVKRD
jgi:hypothetical protein